MTQDNPTFEKDKAVASTILRESAIVEALNLKASILFLMEDHEQARQIIRKVPVI